MPLSTQPWIRSPRYDGWLILAPPFLALLLVLLRMLGFGGAGALPAVAQLVVVFLFKVAAVGLPLAARGGEEALLALAAAAHTRRVVGIVDGPQVAAHLAAATRYACLVSARVRLALPLPLPLPWAWRRCVG